jgi:hypothetical protein
MNEQKRKTFPILKINSKESEKTVEIDGVPTVVKVPAKKGFSVVAKNGDVWETTFLTDRLDGVVLLVRYKIKNVYGAKQMFSSHEFDEQALNGSGKFKVFADKETIFDGTMADAFKKFNSGKVNDYGRPIPDYEIFSVIYILFMGEVLKLEQKHKYKGRFKEFHDKYSSNILSFETNFDLEKKNIAGTDRWLLEPKKGKDVDLIDSTVARDKLMQDLMIKKYQPEQEFSLTTIHRDELITDTKGSEDDSSDNIPTESIPF